MAYIFINPTDQRLRAGWRLLIQALLFFAIMFFGQVITGIIGSVLAIASGIDPTNIEDLTRYILGNPVIRVAGALISLLAIWVSYLVMGRWVDRRPIRDYGFHMNNLWWLDFGFGLALGAVLMVGIFLAERALGWVQITGTMVPGSGGFWGGFLASLIAFISVGFYEEMWSRGYQIRNLAEGLNGRPLNARSALLIAYLLTSTVFGLLHAGNPNATLISTVNIMIAGLFLGLGYILTGELALPIGLHITWNFFQGNVFGFPVSGTNAGATIVGIQQGGPDLWTGGDFGPEAGLIGLLAILVGCLLIFAYTKVTRGKTSPEDRLAVYTPVQGPLPVATYPTPGQEISKVE